MKVTLLLAVMFLFGNADGQLWKEYADSAKVFRDGRKLDEAIVYYNKTKEELKKDSSMTATYAQNSHTLANVYMSKEDYIKAESLYLEAKQIREKVLGNEHPSYAATCNNLAALYWTIRKNEKSEQLYLEAKAIYDKRQDKENPAYGAICNNLGALYERMEQLKNAESLYLEAKQIREKTVGKQHVSYAETNENLANLYSRMGQYEKAEPLYLETKQLWEKLFGAKNLYYSSTCNNLGVLYRNIGLYTKAEMFLLETKQIREKLLGKQHQDYAAPLNNLASLYELLGRYEEAEPFLYEVRKIQEATLGKDHPLYALGCNNLGVFYLNLGQYGKAEPLLIEAKLIQEKIVGKTYVEYASTCNNLATLYSYIGQNRKAEALHTEARQIIEKQLGREHHIYALSNIKLANFYKNIGEYQKAELLLIEAKEIQEKKLGKDHAEYAYSCDNLADLYFVMMRYDKAESLFLEAKNIHKKIFGKEHSSYGASCNNLGKFFWQQSKPLLADKEFQESFLVNLYNLKSVFQFTNEKEKTNYVKNILGEDEISYSFYLSSNKNAELPYSLSLFHRNLILSSSHSIRKHFYSSSDTSFFNRYNEWMNLREQLAFWATKPVVEREGRDIVLKDKADLVEKNLANLSSIFKKEISEENISAKTIQTSLKQDEAAIEFVNFSFYNGKRLTDSNYYIALILKKDKPEPELVYLFEKNQLNNIINVKTGDYKIKIDKLYSTPDLYNLIWKPLEEKLSGISTIYFAAADQLHLLNLSALFIGNNQTIGDKYKLIQMSTTASVVGRNNENINPSDNVILYGGIKYAIDSTSLIEAVQRYKIDNYVVARSLPMNFGELPEIEELFYTQVEVDSIDHFAKRKGFNTTIVSGVNANEESIKAMSGKNSPVILHLATHGFFKPDPISIKAKGSLAGGKAFALSDDPLMRSGLLLAGANNIWSGKPIKGIEDGVLTGYEVSNMYLPNTKLVVLSACETALGQLQGSEGVYGLQRAFKIAGAENLVMSLWQIPDNTTAEFMQVFYQQLFEKKSISEAFYFTQKTMRKKYSANPHKWAGLILIQ